MFYQCSELFLFIVSIFTKRIKLRAVYRFLLILLLFLRWVRKRSYYNNQLSPHYIPMKEKKNWLVVRAVTRLFLFVSHIINKKINLHKGFIHGLVYESKSGIRVRHYIAVF